MTGRALSWTLQIELRNSSLATTQARLDLMKNHFSIAHVLATLTTRSTVCVCGCLPNFWVLVLQAKLTTKAWKVHPHLMSSGKWKAFKRWNNFPLLLFSPFFSGRTLSREYGFRCVACLPAHFFHACKLLRTGLHKTRFFFAPSLSLSSNSSREEILHLCIGRASRNPEKKLKALERGFLAGGTIFYIILTRSSQSRT